jgi:acyl carrier protein
VSDTLTAASEIRKIVVDAILAIAPEGDIAHLDAGRSLRQQLDLDSFDFLNLLIDLHARLGVEIPEADYGRVDSLESLVAYLAARRATG